MNVLRGETLGAGRRVAIVASRFNELVTSRLVEGACGGLSHHGVVPEDVTLAWVPGAFEIPLVAGRLAESGLTVRVELEPDRPRVKRVSVDIGWTHLDRAQARAVRTVALFADRTLGGGS